MKLPAIILSIFLISCVSGKKNSDEHQPASAKKAIFKTGQVIDMVTCDKDTSTSYALYLPAKYDTSGSYPLIVFFDAEARGVLAVNRLKLVAEKLGYIVVGSLSSRNGLTPEMSEQIASTIFDDIRLKLAIDGRRIYTAGFSGGARVATLMALKRMDIAGVIGCSAGMPQWDQPLPSNFFYLGVGGWADFNYFEMTNLEFQLQNTSLPHQFIYRDGGHEMPTTNEFTEALTIIHLVAIKTNLADRNDTLAKEFAKYEEGKIKHESSRKQYAEAHHRYSMLVSLMEGQMNVSEWKTRLMDLEKSKAYVLSEKQKGIADKEEQSLQQKYSKAFSSMELSWWKKEIAGLQIQSKSTTNPYDAAMKKRVLAYIALMAHMNYDAAMKQGAVSKAGDFTEIKILAEPTTPMSYYLRAAYLAGQGKEAESKSLLNKAIALGFSDTQKLISENAFGLLKTSPDYKEILEKIKNNYIKSLAM